MHFRGRDPKFTFDAEGVERVHDLIARLKQRKKKGDPLFDSNDYLDSICHFVKHGTPSWRKRGVCDTPNLYFAILPDGRFAPMLRP